MLNLIIKSLFLYLAVFTSVLAAQEFDQWLKKFKITAIQSGISINVVNEIMSNAKFLPKVIEYDRFQPEFYEDTLTYIKKRSSIRKIRAGVKLYNQERNTIEKIEKEFQVEKELLLALMGIETIQIEINRSLYMDETNLKIHKIAHLQKIFSEIFNNFECSQMEAAE